MERRDIKVHNDHKPLYFRTICQLCLHTEEFVFRVSTLARSIEQPHPWNPRSSSGLGVLCKGTSVTSCRFRELTWWSPGHKATLRSVLSHLTSFCLSKRRLEVSKCSFHFQFHHCSLNTVLLQSVNRAYYHGKVMSSHSLYMD